MQKDIGLKTLKALKINSDWNVRIPRCRKQIVTRVLNREVSPNKVLGFAANDSLSPTGIQPKKCAVYRKRAVNYVCSIILDPIAIPEWVPF